MSYNWTKKIKEIKELDATFLLAISGGVDSMAILDFFNRILPSTHFQVAHFVHGIRDENLEEPMIYEWCKKRNIDMFVGHGVNLKNATNLEAKAREQRWSFLEKIASENNHKIIVTAHHKNDLVENFLVQTMRGMPIESTLMSKFVEKNNFIRYKPFLDTEKSVLKLSAERHNIPWIEDYTNADTHHDRNFIRNQILPQMMERRNVLKTIANTIESIRKIVPEPTIQLEDNLGQNHTMKI